MNIQKQEWYVLGLRDCVTYTNKYTHYVVYTNIRPVEYVKVDVIDLIKRR